MVSVVIPLYNAKETILRTMNSVLQQTYIDPIEIIVVNDGSIDGCETLINKIIAQNETNRIIKLFNKKNGGAASARNVGISESSSEWIAFLDADDTWDNNKLVRQFEIINKNPDILFLGANTNIHTYKFKHKTKDKVFSLNTRDILWQWFPQTSTVLIKKSLIDKVGVYEERRYGEDGDFHLRCSQFTPLYILNEELVNYSNGKAGFGSSGMTAKMDEMYNGEISALQGVLFRKQISIPQYCLFHIRLTSKFFRRIIINKFLR
jgi:glycosyltransferase involved in cell wall biosynthesis